MDTATTSLTIERIETIPVIAPLPREFRGSYYHMTHRATVITRVYTKEGVIGEAYVGDEDKSLRELCAIIEDEIAPRLIGQNALEVERCWDLAFPVTFDILRDRRLGLVALAGVDTAIWDAVGKALGQPLWRLWGGYRNKIQMIAIGGYYGNPLGSIEEEMNAYRELGLAGVKFKVGGASPAEDYVRVAEARRAAGDDFIIAIDANQGYAVQDAVELSRRLVDQNIMWFEEPVQWQNDARSLRDVRNRGSLPVCAGQSEYSPAGCRNLMETGSIDFLNFDASWSGGPTAWRRAAAVATTYDVRVGHHEEPQVSTHLLSSQPHGTFSECFHPDRDPFWWNLIENRPELKNGWMELSDRAGLGWDLNWDYINKYKLD